MFLTQRAIYLFLLIITLFLNTIRGEEKELRFHYITPENGPTRNFAYSIAEDKFGFMWFASVDGLYRFDGYKMKQYSAVPSDPRALINNRPRKLVKDNQGNIWIVFSSADPVCRYNYETDDFTRFYLPHLPKPIQQLIRSEKDSKIENDLYRWELQTNKLVQTNKKTNAQITYSFNPNKNYGLKDELISKLYLDSRNTLWVATDAGGICFADVNQPDFRLYSFTVKASINIKESTIRAIYQSLNGDLWVGTRHSGVIRLDRKSNSKNQFKHSEDDLTSITNERIRKIYKDKYGQLWIGTKNGIDRFDHKQNRFHHYPSLVNANIDNTIFGIEEDGRSDLWIGIWEAGLFRYDRLKDQFFPYNNKSDKDYTWNIRTLLREGAQNLWIGTEGCGLSLLKRGLYNGRERYSFERFVHNPGDENSLSDDRIYCLCKDRNGFLWIGTGRGLNRLDPRTGKFIHFPEKKYISNNMIFGMVCDEYNNLWISHQAGLTRLKCSTFKTNNYSTNPDLYDIEFSADAYYRNPQTGECFFGGNLGILSFHPASIQENPYPPRVYVTGLRISGKTITPIRPFNGRIILKRPVYLTNTISLHWDERNIELDFTALHFTNPCNNTFAYRLTGFDKEWKITDASHRAALYTNLPSGKYFFEVKAANSDGIWTKKTTLLKIEIFPPWWRTWWAYLFYSLLFAVVIYLIFRIIIAREKLKHQIQFERFKADKASELERVKSTFFTNISHELRTPLTLIVDPVKHLLEGPELDKPTRHYFLQLISENAKRLQSLVNQLLDLKKIESGEMKLHISLIDIVAKVKSLVGMFELQAREHLIHFEFSSDNDSLQVAVDVDKLDKIIINLLSNAFKFTPDGGEISAKIIHDKIKNEFELTIQDSGVGISQEEIGKIFEPFYQVEENEKRNGTGIGLALVKELVVLLGASIFVESTIGKGTIFQLVFPVGEKQGVHIESSESDQLIDTGNQIVGPVCMSNQEDEESVSDSPLILVVEDNKEVREYLYIVLKDHFKVLVAVNGQEGFDMAVELVPDLVVSDVMMPVMGGIELCERLKTDQRTSHIPVILLTARQSEELKVTSYETGADDYITKPFNSATLSARIYNLIESRHKLRLLFDKSTGYNTKIIAVNQLDKSFLDTLVCQIHENLTSATFDIDELAFQMNMNRMQLSRKIKSLTNKTARNFVLTVRLSKAAELLLSGLYSITEVSEMVGYNEAGNFTRSFTREFGESPQKYIISHRN